MNWVIKSNLSPYLETVKAMEYYVENVISYTAPESIWFVEHPALYTLGTSGKESDILNRQLPIHNVGRGGQVTYHGPGQRVVYMMMDLRQRGQDIHYFIHQMQAWIIAVLGHFHIKACTHHERVGIWVPLPCNREAKIAAIGIRVRKWVTYHGFALNINPDLNHFNGIIPCGLPFYKTTSLAKLGLTITFDEVDDIFKKKFSQFF